MCPNVSLASHIELLKFSFWNNSALRYLKQLGKKIISSNGLEFGPSTGFWLCAPRAPFHLKAKLVWKSSESEGLVLTLRSKVHIDENGGFLKVFISFRVWGVNYSRI